MLHTLFVALLIGAVIFLILTVLWESLSFGILDIILWFILSAAVHSIEMPYVAIQNDNTIIEGVQIIENMHVVSALFILIGVIMLLYWLTSIVFPMFSQEFKRMM